MCQPVDEGVGGDQRRVVGLAQALDASEHVEIAADRREVDPVAAADIAVGDLPNMKCDADLKGSPVTVAQGRKRIECGLGGTQGGTARLGLVAIGIEHGQQPVTNIL